MLQQIHADVFIDDNVGYVCQVGAVSSCDVVQGCSEGAHSLREIWVEPSHSRT